MDQILQLDVLRSSSSAASLIWLLKTLPAPMSMQSGVAVGSLMKALRIPQCHWIDFAANLAKSWFLKCPDGQNAVESYQNFIDGMTQVKHHAEISGGSEILTGSDLNAPASPFEVPRSLSLSSIQPLDMAYRITNSQARDPSVAATELSALDTFTTELLAEAEECSTTGPFSRHPSMFRAIPEFEPVGGIADCDDDDRSDEWQGIRDAVELGCEGWHVPEGTEDAEQRQHRHQHNQAQEHAVEGGEPKQQQQQQQQQQQRQERHDPETSRGLDHPIIDLCSDTDSDSDANTDPDTDPDTELTDISTNNIATTTTTTVIADDDDAAADGFEITAIREQGRLWISPRY
jgi:hypothetical protein